MHNNDVNCSNNKTLFSHIVFKKDQKTSILLELRVIYANIRIGLVIWMFKMLFSIQICYKLMENLYIA